MEERTSWIQPSLRSISSCLPSSPLSLLVLRIACIYFGIFPLCDYNSLWSGFLTCMQIGKLQDAELSLVRFMWSQGAWGRWGAEEVLTKGVGDSKMDISPACNWPNIVSLSVWLTLTAAIIWKGPQLCAAARPSPLPSLFCVCFPHMLFFSLSLCLHYLICIRGQEVPECMREMGDSLADLLHPIPTLI